MKTKTFKQYLERQGLSENTVESYTWTAKHFTAQHGEPTAESLQRYRERLIRERRPQTVNVRLMAMNRYLEYTGHPDLKVRLVRISRKNFLENVISDADYRFFKRRLKEDGHILWHYVVWFLAATGARVSELRQIKAEHVQTGHLDIYSKGGKLRRLYIPERLRTTATAWLDGRGIKSGYIFLNRFGQRLTARGIALQLKRYAKKYELEPSVVYPHSFRHLFARNFLDRRKDIAMLADLMGHESIETTRIYLRRTSVEQQSELDRLVDW